MNYDGKTDLVLLVTENLMLRKRCCCNRGNSYRHYSRRCSDLWHKILPSIVQSLGTTKKFIRRHSPHGSTAKERRRFVRIYCSNTKNCWYPYFKSRFQAENGEYRKILRGIKESSWVLYGRVWVVWLCGCDVKNDSTIRNLKGDPSGSSCCSS